MRILFVLIDEHWSHTRRYNVLIDCSTSVAEFIISRVTQLHCTHTERGENTMSVLSAHNGKSWLLMSQNFDDIFMNLLNNYFYYWLLIISSDIIPRRRESIFNILFVLNYQLYVKKYTHGILLHLIAHDIII